MHYLSSAFTFASVLETLENEKEPVAFIVRKVTVAEAQKWATLGEWQSRVGHTDAAERIGIQLGLVVPVCREQTPLSPGDEILVAQYSGPRLAERAGPLPADAPVVWLLVQFAGPAQEHTFDWGYYSFTGWEELMPLWLVEARAT